MAQELKTSTGAKRGPKPKGNKRMEIQASDADRAWLRYIAHRAQLPVGEVIHRLIQLHSIHFEVSTPNSVRRARD